jgi:hypothetical protein
MHTPRPAPDPLDPLHAQNLFDSSWAIFDQNSIALAPSTGFSTHSGATTGGESGNGMVIFTAGNGGVSHASGLEDRDPGFAASSGGGEGTQTLDAADGQWLGNSGEHYSDAWQNTFFRLFGSAEMPMSGHEYAPSGS